MKAKTRPKRAAELTPRHRNMRKKSFPLSCRPAMSSKKVSGEVQTKRLPRKPAKRQTSKGRRPVNKPTGFNGTYVLGAVIALLALLLTGALIVTILEKPQAAEAWSLVREIFPPTVTALLAFLGARYSLSKRP